MTVRHFASQVWNYGHQLGCGWWILLVGLFLIGWSMLALPGLVGLLTWVDAQVSDKRLYPVLGIILLATSLAHVANIFFTVWTNSSFNLEPAAQENALPPAVLGLAEVPMFLVAFMLGKPELWLAGLGIKVAGGWLRWQGTDEDKANAGRRRFYRFLLGNIMNLGFAGLAFLVIRFRVLG